MKLAARRGTLRQGAEKRGQTPNFAKAACAGKGVCVAKSVSVPLFPRLFTSSRLAHRYNKKKKNEIGGAADMRREGSRRGTLRACATSAAEGIEGTAVLHEIGGGGGAEFPQTIQ